MGLNGTTWRDARFSGQGRIVFTLPIGVALPKATMTQAIKLADRLGPWNCSYIGGHPAPSILWMSEPVVTAEGNGVDRLYEVLVRPPFMLKSSELAAYYSYVAQLARELSEMALPNVVAVSGSVEFRGGSHYYIKPEDRAVDDTAT